MSKSTTRRGKSSQKTDEDYESPAKKSKVADEETTTELTVNPAESEVPGTPVEKEVMVMETPKKMDDRDLSNLTQPDEDATPMSDDNVVYLVEAKNMTPIRMTGPKEAELFKTNYPDKFIALKKFKNEEDAASFMKDYVVTNVITSTTPVIAGQNSPVSVMDGSPIHGDGALAGKMKSYIDKNQRKCTIAVIAFTFTWSQNVAFIIRFYNRDGKDYWCFKPNNWADSCKAYAEIAFASVRYGEHYNRDAFKTLTSTVLRDRSKGPNDKLTVRGDKNKNAYNVYALSGIIQNPYKSKKAATIQITGLIQEMQHISQTTDFQEAYKYSLGDTKIWDKMNGFNAEFWKDFKTANIAINYEEHYAEILPLVEAKQMSDYVLQYTPAPTPAK